MSLTAGAGTRFLTRLLSFISKPNDKEHQHLFFVSLIKASVHDQNDEKLILVHNLHSLGAVSRDENKEQAAESFVFSVSFMSAASKLTVQHENDTNPDTARARSLSLSSCTICLVDQR